MKLATVDRNGEQMPAIVHADGKRLLPIKEIAATAYPDLECLQKGIQEIIAAGETVFDALRDMEQTAPYPEEWILASDVKWLAPIPRPAKNIFCVGKNYAEHAIEMGSKDDIPEHIMLFSKAPTSVTGHEQPVPLHEEVTGQLDYEGELAIIIGKKGRAIPKEEAFNYIFGYTVLNDVTARDLQARHKQFLLGKSLDGSCPMGPYIVHISALPDPENLKIITKVNGEIRQNGHTGQFIFKIPEMIEVLSKGMTLEPGDIIATGTPAGVGKGFNPPKFLKRGDIVEIEVEGIGTLRNRID